jgi:hypothetical protein
MTKQALINYLDSARTTSLSSEELANKLIEKFDMTVKSQCEHQFEARWAHHDCTKCGAVKFGNSKADREDYGVAAGKIFKNMGEAKFYQQNGRLPE